MKASPHHAPSNRGIVFAKVAASLFVLSLGAIAMLPIAVLTLFRTRRVYAAVAALSARGVLRLWGIRMVVHHEEPWPAGQVVYVSNHPCSLDPFLLAALRMPNVRFFLSQEVQKFVPLGLMARMMGTFFTVRQDRPAERVRIFQRADRILRRTGESVYLSPEGQRVATGEIGHFNKGSFHLATSLRAPIVPMYFSVPREVDPGKGFDARPGTVHIFVHRAIDTSRWRLEDLSANRDAVRNLFVAWHRERREAQATAATSNPAG